MKTTKIQFKCDKCGKILEKCEKDSKKQWAVYNVHKPCECGGKFQFESEVIAKQ